MDLGVLGFSIALTVATSLLFGLTPALSAAGIHIQEAMRTSGLCHSSRAGHGAVAKGAGGGGTRALPGFADWRRLAGAQSLPSRPNRAWLRLRRVCSHFASTRSVLSTAITPTFYGDVLERLQQIPLVSSATLVADMPLNDEDFYQTGRIRVAGRPPIPFAERPIINNSLVSPEFLRTLKVPLKSGRFFDAYDAGRSEEVVPGFVAAEPVVVNESFVQRIFPGENPLGQRLVFGPDQRNITWTIIGVVGDVRGGTLGADPPSMVYRCTCSGNPVFRAGFIVRTQGRAGKCAVRAVQKQVRAVDPDQPIFDVRTMDERRDAALAPGRFALAYGRRLRDHRDSSCRGRCLRCDVLSRHPPHARNRHSSRHRRTTGQHPQHGHSPKPPSWL